MREGKSIDIVTADEMRQLDRYTIDKLGIPALTLMENAGRAVADEVMKLCAVKSRASHEDTGGTARDNVNPIRAADGAERFREQAAEEAIQAGLRELPHHTGAFGWSYGMTGAVPHCSRSTGIFS